MKSFMAVEQSKMRLLALSRAEIESGGLDILEQWLAEGSDLFVLATPPGMKADPKALAAIIEPGAMYSVRGKNGNNHFASGKIRSTF